MNQILSQLDVINELLMENSSAKNGVGLLNGKLGLSIYFFSLARETKNAKYQETAESLIGEVYHSIGETTTSPDFEDGLAGIACGICYLVRNGYVDADLDDILGEVDDRIYKYLIDNIRNSPVSARQGLLGYLIYYTYRLACTTNSGDKVNKYIFRMICVELINHIGQLVEEDKFHSREPALFTVFWDLPILLKLLADARKLNINSDKIDRILDYLTPIVTSLYPKLHANRLYLLLGMENVLTEVSVPDWRTHAGFLRKGIEASRIINRECKSLNILLMDGVSGLAFIARELAELTNDTGLLLCEEEVIAKIKESVLWGDTDLYREMKTNIGLCVGLSGMGLLLLEFLRNKRKIEMF